MPLIGMPSSKESMESAPSVQMLRLDLVTHSTLAEARGTNQSFSKSLYDDSFNGAR
jgi:hypothetical protein